MCSLHEDLGKEIVSGRHQAVEAAKEEHAEKGAKKQSARRQKEQTDKFIGLVSPHQEDVGRPSFDDSGSCDKEGLIALGQQTASFNDELFSFMFT